MTLRFHPFRDNIYYQFITTNFEADLSLDKMKTIYIIY
jgi:hypothetical protein